MFIVSSPAFLRSPSGSMNRNLVGADVGASPVDSIRSLYSPENLPVQFAVSIPFSKRRPVFVY